MEQTENVGSKLQIVSISGNLLDWGEHDSTRIEQNVELLLVALEDESRQMHLGQLKNGTYLV